MKCDCKSMDGTHEDFCDKHPANIATEREAELLAHIETLERQVFDYKFMAEKFRAALADIAEGRGYINDYECPWEVRRAKEALA